MLRSATGFSWYSGAQISACDRSGLSHHAGARARCRQIVARVQDHLGIRRSRQRTHYARRGGLLRFVSSYRYTTTSEGSPGLSTMSWQRDCPLLLLTTGVHPPALIFWIAWLPPIQGTSPCSAIT